MTKTLRESQEELADLVERASRGEDVLITVDGEVKARLTKAEHRPLAMCDREDVQSWMERLRVLREGEVGPNGPTNTPQEFWDELREDKI